MIIHKNNMYNIINKLLECLLIFKYFQANEDIPQKNRMMMEKMQKYAINKDRLMCSSCKDPIKGAAVKAGGNLWHKVSIKN